jgi:hypothetical protein
MPKPSFSGMVIRMTDGIEYRLTPAKDVLDDVLTRIPMTARSAATRTSSSRPSRPSRQDWTKDEILVVAGYVLPKKASARKAAMALAARKLNRTEHAVSYKISNLRGTTNGGNTTKKVARLMSSNPRKFAAEARKACRRIGLTA